MGSWRRAAEKELEVCGGSALPGERDRAKAPELGPSAKAAIASLFLAYLGGLLAADAFASGPGSSSLYWLVGAAFAAFLAISFSFAISFAFGFAALGRGRARKSAVGFGLVLLLAFSAGAIRIEHRFARASIDRARAEAVASEGKGASRRVEATVEARRVHRWGAEIMLRNVIARDEGSILPERLVLSLSGRGRRGRADDVLWPSARIQMVVRIEPLFFARNPGSPDRERSAAVRGFGARARLVDPDWVIVVEPRIAVLRESARLREVLRDNVAERLPEHVPGAGLARALVLGDRRALAPEASTAFRALGLSHLIVISGLHVGIIVSLMFAAWRIASRVRKMDVRRSHRPERYGVLLVTLLALAAYAWLAGAGPSVLRAALAVVIFAAARKVGRDLAPMSTLCLVGLSLLVLEPALALDLGARLSFAACAGIITVLSGVSDIEAPAHGLGRNAADRFGGSRVARICDAARTALFVSLAASFATAPFLERSDLPLALIGPVANLVAVPILAMLVLPSAILAVSIEGLVGGALGPLAEGVGWEGGIGDGVVRALLAPVAGFDSAVRSLAEFAMEAPPIAETMLVALAGVAAAGLAAARRGWLVRSALIWILVWALSGGAPSVGRGDLADVPRLVLLDVGQGDATLIQGRASAVLVDAGGGTPGMGAGTKVVRALRSLGVTRLDRLVVTHGDSDHRAGAPGILEAFEVGALWLPRGAEDDPRLIGLAELARAHSVPVIWMSAGVPTRVGEIELEVLWPGPQAASARRSRNDGSLVLRVTVRGLRTLLMADVGAEVERAILLSDRDIAADVLKVGHHGSRHSTLPAFLESVQPRLAILSAPCRPHRGLPHARVIGSLEDRGIAVRWTGRSGAISIGLDGFREQDGLSAPLPAGAGEPFVVRRWGPVRRCQGAD